MAKIEFNNILTLIVFVMAVLGTMLLLGPALSDHINTAQIVGLSLLVGVVAIIGISIINKK